jgi:hypothetical protein
VGIFTWPPVGKSNWPLTRVPLATGRAGPLAWPPTCTSGESADFIATISRDRSAIEVPQRDHEGVPRPDMMSAYYQVLVRAFRLAGRGSDACRPIHVFAALADGEGSVATALSSGIGPVLPDPSALPGHGENAGSSVGQLQRAAQRFASERGAALAPEHLFLAGIDQGDPEAMAALDQAGLDTAVLRTAVLSALGEPPDLPPIAMPPVILRSVSNQPLVTKPVEWGQQHMTSASDLASELGDAVWIPYDWPTALGGPEVVLLRSPGANRRPDGYYLHGLNEAGLALVVSGYRRRPGGHLESRLRSVRQKPFEILSRPEGDPTHVVARMPVFDVHLSGDAVSRADAIDLALGLREIPRA